MVGGDDALSVVHGGRERREKSDYSVVRIFKKIGANDNIVRC